MKNIFKFKVFLLMFYLTSNLSAFENSFVIEKDCPIYKFENEKFLKILKNSEKPIKLNSENFEVKDIKKLKKSEYVKLKNHDKQFNLIDDFYINKNCGYFLIENEKQNIKFPERFLKKEEASQIEKAMKQIDKEILGLCGNFGSHPQKEKFIEILKNHPDELKLIYKELNKKNLSFDEFFLEITEILFKSNGFAHVFCGLLKEEKISGPHYAPRFFELDKKNLIGFLGEKEKLDKKIFNIKKDLGEENFLINRSLSFLNHKKEIKTKSENSFILKDNFFELLKIITKIGHLELNELKLDNKDYEKLMKNNKSQIKSCVLDEKNRFYKIVFKNKSLITLYPILEYKKEEICKFN